MALGALLGVGRVAVETLRRSLACHGGVGEGASGRGDRQHRIDVPVVAVHRNRVHRVRVAVAREDEPAPLAGRRCRVLLDAQPSDRERHLRDLGEPAADEQAVLEPRQSHDGLAFCGLYDEFAVHHKGRRVMQSLLARTVSDTAGEEAQCHGFAHGGVGAGPADQMPDVIGHPDEALAGRQLDIRGCEGRYSAAVLAGQSERRQQGGCGARVEIHVAVGDPQAADAAPRHPCRRALHHRIGRLPARPRRARPFHRQWGGPAEVEALGVVDTERTQQIHGLLILHALGDRLQAEPAREPDDRADHMLVGDARARVPNELAIDLEEVHRQVLEVMEAAVAAAEVVEGEPATEMPEPLGQLDRDRGVCDQRGLSDLEHEPRRIGPGARQLMLDVGDQPCVPDRSCRDIDLHVDPARGEIGGLGDHPAIDVADRSVLLGRRQERGRRDQRAAGVAHADQQLALDRLARGEVDDRLSVQLEAILLERAPDLPEPGDVLELGVQRCLALLALGDVHHLPEQDVDVAIGVPDRRDVDGCPDLRAVGSHVALVRDVVVQLAGQEPAHVLSTVRKIVGVTYVGELQLVERVACAADHGAERIVDAQEGEVRRVDERHRDGSVVEALPKALLRAAQLHLGAARLRDVLDGAAQPRQVPGRIAHRP